MQTPLTDTHPEVERLQINLLRNAGTQRRFELTFSLSQDMIELSRSALSQRYPALTEHEQQLKFVALCYGEELAKCVTNYLQRRSHEQL